MILEYLKLFASLTKDYEERFLTESPGVIENDWWEALQFFFSKVFYRGRRDFISEEVERRVIASLSRYFNNVDIRDLEFDKLKEGNWKETREELMKEIGKGKIGSALDIDLTISTLTFVSSIQDKNIVNHSVTNIRSGQIYKHYNELQRIRGMGPKVSSLYLRDLVSLFDLEEHLKNEQDFATVMPVDTWIRKITKSLRIAGEKANDADIVSVLIKESEESNVSPILINQGIWYVGTRSFETCFDRILKAVEEMKQGENVEASKHLVECARILEVLLSLEKDQGQRSRLEDYRRRLLSLAHASVQR